jgi:predicted dehydrogenase
MRVAFIGCGLVGLKRAQSALALGLQVIGAADSAPGRAAAMLKSLGSSGAGAIAAQDAATVLALKPDLAVIATPHYLLAGLTIEAVMAGCHVLVEKPAALSAAELDPVIAAATDRGRLVHVGYNHRFHPAIRKAREIVDSGALGPLMFIRGRYGHGGRSGMEQEWRSQRALSGGGELIDQGSHLIDLSRWFLGNISNVRGLLAHAFWPIAVEDNCFLALGDEQGRIAWLHASWSEWKNLFSFEIYGRDGKLQIDGLGGSYGTERLSWYRMLPQMGPPETTIWEYPGPDQSWEAELRAVIEAVGRGANPACSLSDAHATLSIIGQVYNEGWT